MLIAPIYKPSQYNHCLDWENEILLFNSYSQKFGRIKQNDECKRLLSQKSEKQDTPLYRALIREGYLVPDETDEVLLGDLRHLNMFTENKLSLVLLPTEQCNFRCVYCYESFKKGRMKTDVQEGIIRWLRKQLTSYSGLNVSWFGGEPLLALDILENLSEQMMALCQKSTRPYEAAITCNGYLLDADTMRRLLKCRISQIQITLDGPAESHDHLRVLCNGSGSYDKIIHNLCEIRDTITSNAFRIIIRTNVTKDNLPLIPQHIENLHRLFGYDRRFQFYFRPAGDWGGDRVQKVQDNLISDLWSLYEPLLSSPYVLSYDPYLRFLQNGMCNTGKKNSLVIGSDGNVYKCTMLFDQEENCLGTLDQTGYMTIDQQKLARWIIPRPLEADCIACNHRPSCNGGTCPAKRFILNSEGKCGYENSSIDWVLKLLARRKMNGESPIPDLLTEEKNYVHG